MTYVINQTGFQPDSVKNFFISQAESRYFQICNFIGKIPVLERRLLHLKCSELSGESDLYFGDFSDFTDEGIFYIRCAFKESEPFKIEKHIYEDLYKASVKFYYFQRSSVPLEEKYAAEWKRDAGHPDDNLILHHSTGKQGLWSAPGGWYDAGDYGKYTVTAGITVQTLLTFHDMFPLRKDPCLNIPESGNGLPDLLNEIRFELEWLMKMQDADGGVFFKTGSLNWSGHVEPSADNLDRYVIGKSTSSTLSFAAAAAKASSVYRMYDPDFSSGLLNAAEKSWQWAAENPDVPYPDECGGTGLYADDNYKEKFTAAAIELLTVSDKSIYAEYIKDTICFEDITEPVSWKHPELLSYFTLVSQSCYPEKGIIRKLRNLLLGYADRMVKISQKSSYKIPMLKSDFIWGSNSIILNKGVMLCLAHFLTGDKKYLDCASAVLNYILGFNPCGISYVTGFGMKSSEKLHYRPYLSGKYKIMPPGFLAGGPNIGKEDNLKYNSGFPMCSYLDSADSFASNECAVNWNSALVFVTGYLHFYSENNKE
ncbi:MAG: glycoside hydrolase family 9 protein [Spirochaetes bacterium]|nr:glycoside hydrolase family 9 protein [Spirochaetota bacterium]